MVQKAKLRFSHFAWRLLAGAAFCMMAHWLQCLHILLSVSIYSALSLAKQKKKSSRKRREDAEG